MTHRKHYLDTVRFLALIGILINHCFNNSPAEKIVNILQDYHAVLFVLLMGVFIDTKSPAKKTLIRSSVLIGTGFALGSSTIVIDVILIQLGLLNIIVWGISQYIHKTRTLFFITSIWLIISPIISITVRNFFEKTLLIIPTQKNIGLELLIEDPVSFVLRPFFYSSYPVLQWTTIILIGMILKSYLNAQWWRISIIGLTMFCFAKLVSFFFNGSLWTMDNGTPNNWTHLFDSGAYTGTTLGILSSVGMGIVIIGFVKFLDNLLKWRINPYLSGSTLTLYSLHTFSFTMIPMYILENTPYSLALFSSTLIGFVIVSYIWYRLSKFYGFTKYGALEEFTYYLTTSKTAVESKQ